MPRQQALAEKYLGKVPDVNEMEKNMSIVFCNQREIISFVKPQPSNIIQFGGLHLLQKPAPLSDVNIVLRFSNNDIFLSK